MSSLNMSLNEEAERQVSSYVHQQFTAFGKTPTDKQVKAERKKIIKALKRLGR